MKRITNLILLAAVTAASAILPLRADMTLWGDANCDGQTDMADIVLVLQARSNPNQYGLNGSHPSHITAQGIENADVCDPLGELTDTDALLIQQALLGTIPNGGVSHTNNMVASGAEVGFSFVDGAGNRTVAVKPGQSTTFDVFVNISAGARPISAIDVNFACSSPIQISGISDSVTAFEGQPVSYNLEELRANYVALDGYEPVLPQDGKAAFKLSVTVPANTPEGVYTIGFGDNCTVLKDNTGAIYTTSVTPLAICVGAPYYDPVGGTNAVCKAYTAYTGQTLLNGGWYLLTGDITNDASIAVYGNAHLILADGASLTVRNIDVQSGKSFTVWAQSDGANMGKLTATGRYGYAGIGGWGNDSDITVTINGGEVTATGDESAAGIGGGDYGSGITVTVNGGKVTATGSSREGAGIGGGTSGSDITVTVNGGTVTATGSREGAGIGGGRGGSGITVTINGGEVTAKGGDGGAGIGGGYLGSGVTVTIAGGEVEANGSGCAGIGGGVLGSGITVKINPVGGKMIDVEAGNNKYVAVPVAGSPFAKETDVTSLLAEKYFVKTRAVMGYLDPTDPANPVKTFDDYAYYAGETTLTSGWYVVTGDIENGTRIVVEGDAHLILADGASLTATEGINVEVKNNVTNSLTIWAQSDGANMGKLTAFGVDFAAGIGGGDGGAGGTVTVNGGEVTARGGYLGGAGIGGGYNGSGGTVTVNGGKVTATNTGGVGVGIGGGDNGDGGTVTINGGEVTAQGGDAGIGGGRNCSGGTVTVNGGKLTAQGGSGGAGIGGTVTVNGGEVTAFVGWDGSAGIGGTVTIKPAGGKMIAVEAGADAGSAVPVAGSPFAAETDVTDVLDGKKFVRTEALPTYLDPTDPDNPVKTLDDYAYYAGETTLTSGWYVVTGDITNDASITVSGNVNLILADGASLTATEGINVEVKNNVTNSLTIWAQSAGANMGRLTAQGGVNAAGIGGGNMGTGGTVTITGGKVTAQGGNNGAGIGGGNMGTGGTVTINGGKVTAQGGDSGAGIGGGIGGAGGKVTINGGEVTAKGGDDAAGIGAGWNGSGGTVTVKPSAGMAISVAAGDDEGGATPVAGSPFAAETDVTSLLAGKRFAQTGAFMGYLDPTDPAHPVKKCDAYAYYAGEMTLTSGWYVVEGSVNVSGHPATGRITVKGDAHLILADGASLTAIAGITVDVNNNITNSLTIWAQSDGANMGKLTAMAMGGWGAGIGGENGSTCGTVTVNGGNVTAQGHEGGAGIGGGDAASGGTVTVNGGKVTAEGGDTGGAGIGGGGGWLEREPFPKSETRCMLLLS